MSVVLKADGIEMRALTVGDAQAHKRGEDDVQIKAFEFPGPAPIANVIAAIERWQDSWSTDGPVRNFGVWHSDSGELVGNVEVELTSDARVNLSYVVFPDFRGQGIATKACRLALRYAGEELGARSATLKVLDWNAASIAVAVALGGVRLGAEQSSADGTFLLYEIAIPTRTQ